MAVLSDADRAAVTAEFLGWLSAHRHELTGVQKSHLRSAINSIDSYLNDNAASINSAIPQPARGALSAAQKALLLQYVVAKRYLSGV